MNANLPIRFIFSKIVLSFFIVGCFTVNSFAAKPEQKEETMVQKFYTLHPEPLYWFSSDENKARAMEWLTAVESADSLGLTPDYKVIGAIRTSISEKNNVQNISDADKKMTGLVLDFIKHLQQGNVSFDYDEISSRRDSVYIGQLIDSKSVKRVSEVIARLDCKDPGYLLLKNYIRDSIRVKNTLKGKKVMLAMNYRRYFSINRKAQYIRVNIPAAEAVYYKDGLPVITMRAVVGKKSHPTPTIASYITNIVTFPNWNVPQGIGVKEILPKVQKNDNYLEQNNFEVVNSRGKVIDSDLNWNKYTEKNFPYFFRQGSGSDNSLGVVKFNLIDPFSIFLHSTSAPAAFKLKSRFLSHGCVRLEKPLELANTLLNDTLDLEELKAGKKDTESKTIELNDKLATFIVYNPVAIVGGKVTFFNDVYNLIK